MNGKQFNAYQEEQLKNTLRHFNKKQWKQDELPFHEPNSIKEKRLKSKEEFYSKIAKKKPTEDIEAILEIEDDLWNS